VGRDEKIIEGIESTSTGVGKKRVEQICVTHSHYDHVEMLKRIKKKYKSKVYAFSKHLPSVDHILKDGETCKMGDRIFEVIHCPGHSHDSVCFYCKEEGVLFSGDAPIKIIDSKGTHEDALIAVLERLVQLKIQTIYFGHGLPYTGNCTKMLETSLKHAK